MARNIDDEVAATVDALEGFGGKSCLSNLMVGVMSRGFPKREAQVAVSIAIDMGKVKLDDQMRAVLVRKPRGVKKSKKS